MTDRVRTPVSLTTLRIGRTDLGAATALLDDDALTLVVHVEMDEKPFRVRLATIDSIHAAGQETELVLRDGTRVVIAAVDSALRDDLLLRCRALPELTRTLRSFGSSRARRARRETDASEQARFFGPLLDARRSAAALDSVAAIGAFDGAALSAAMRATLAQFAADRHVEPGPARRALEAELEDAAEPLTDALRLVAESASAAASAADDLRAWRTWSASLRAAFETADRVWNAVDAALDAAPVRAGAVNKK